MDLNGDGHLDVLSGSYSRMSQDMAGLFQVLWGQAKGGFRTAQELKGTDGEPLIIKAEKKDDIVEVICTRPFAVDWDGDKHLDLVVGNFAGSFYLFKGEGKGRFAPGSELMTAKGQRLAVSGRHSDPFCIDWDGDGDLDLMSGASEGGVHWAENVARKGAPPELTSFKVLIPPGERQKPDAFLREADLQGPSGDTRIWVDDVNRDGKLDILVGDSTTLVSPAAGLTRARCEEKLKAWEKKSDEMQKAMQEQGAEAKEEEQEKLSKAFGEHYQSRKEFLNEESTGFVWLYLQK